MSENKSIIRHAQINDIPELLPLLAQLGYPCALEDLEARFIRFIDNPGYGVAICEINNEFAGCVAYSRSQLFVLNATRFHIEGLIVAENYRGKGIGKKLMLFVEEIAKCHSPAIVDLTSSLWREEATKAHSFYQNLGYDNKKHSAYFRKEL